MVVPSLMPLPADKVGLRAEGLRRRRDFARSLTPALRRELEAELARLVLPHLAGAGVIAAYHPLRDEIDPAAILAGLAPHQRCALPWFAHRDAVFVWREGPATDPSPWGVAQPGPEAEALAPEVVLVPLVLADRSGARIGHGKGHYDRALANLRAGGGPVFTIGIGWDDQLVDEAIPADPWDISLDAVATPKEWIRCA
jgi:5-formyltetrahydrofolate cyclo-ligase